MQSGPKDRMLKNKMIGKKDPQKTERMNELVRKSYYLLGILTFAFLAEQLSCLMDYYVLQDGSNYLSFWITHNYYGRPVLLLFCKVVIFCLLVFFYGVCGHFGISSAITSALCFILAFAGRLKYINRSELIKYTDLFLKGAANVAANFVQLDISPALFLFLGIGAVISAVAIYIEHECRNFKKSIPKGVRLGVRIGAAVLPAVFLIFYVPNFMKAQNTSFTNVFTSAYSNQYVIYQFLEKRGANTGNEGIQSAIELLLNRAEENSTGENTQTQTDAQTQTDTQTQTYTQTQTDTLSPNVIVIMSEAWWNLDMVGEGCLTYSQDPMAIYHELAGEGVSGVASANLYGGGTYLSELEFLTGTNGAMNNESYTEMISKGADVSLVSYFKELSYDTVAIHPYYSSFYDRDQIYPELGFDRLVFEDDMQYTDLYDNLISDDSLANQIIYEYQQQNSENTQNPIFIWSVSVASHCSMPDDKYPLIEDYDYPILAYTADGSLANDTILHYVNGSYYAQEAYRKLTEYFAGVDEPVVILMFGDHSPNVMSYNDILGLSADSEDYEDLKRMYTVPVLMWKNYEGGENVQDFSGENISYLSAAMLDYAGLPDCDIAVINRYYQSEIKAYTYYYQIDNDYQQFRDLTEIQSELLSNLQVVYYGIVNHMSACDEIWSPYLE